MSVDVVFLKLPGWSHDEDSAAMPDKSSTFDVNPEP